MSPSGSSLPPDCFTAYATTGESASMASALPVTTAAVAWLWSLKDKTLILLLPHFFCRAGRSSVSWTVLVWTAMFLPQALSGSMPLGLPCARRPLGAGGEVADHVDLLHALGLMVNDEMPMSYFLPLTPVMMRRSRPAATRS